MMRVAGPYCNAVYHGGGFTGHPPLEETWTVK